MGNLRPLITVSIDIHLLRRISNRFLSKVYFNYATGGALSEKYSSGWINTFCGAARLFAD